MVSMPRTPADWANDLEDLQINANPAGDAPITVTDPGALNRASPDLGAGPDPGYYAELGEMDKQIMSDPYDPDGNLSSSGAMYDLGQLLQFHRGGALDAQSYGASPDYGNYVFGIYNAARGAALPDTLDLANLYGKLFSKYPQKTEYDQTYTSISAANVQNITGGYKDYSNGTLRRKP